MPYHAAGTRMQCELYRPPQPLGDFVDCFWHFHGRRATRELALPTGTTELVINLRQNEMRIYSDVSDPHGQGFSGAVISGPQTRYFVLGASAELSVIGVHFRPGGAAALLGMPLSELTDRHVSLEQVLCAQGRALREEILNAESTASAFQLLERALIARLRSRCVHPAVAFALRRFTAQPAIGAAVGEVTAATGYSAKRFIRLFTDQGGVSPKRFCRILRLQAVLKRLASASPVEWAEVALDGGYYDQSHLIHDFRAMTSLTPTQYRAIDSDSPNHVAIR